jgi:hypothetical protein
MMEMEMEIMTKEAATGQVAAVSRSTPPQLASIELTKLWFEGEM